MATRWLDDREARAWRAYRRMRLVLDLRINRDLARDSGLSEPDYDVLSYLSESPDQRVRITEMAERLHWSKSRLSHHLARMQQRGLVDRHECANDARGSFVVLTPNGLRAIQAAAPLHVASVRAHMIDLLTPEELEALTAFGDRIADRLGSSCEAARPENVRPENVRPENVRPENVRPENVRPENVRCETPRQDQMPRTRS